MFSHSCKVKYIILRNFIEKGSKLIFFVFFVLSHFLLQNICQRVVQISKGGSNKNSKQNINKMKLFIKNKFSFDITNILLQYTFSLEYSLKFIDWYSIFISIKENIVQIQKIFTKTKYKCFYITTQYNLLIFYYIKKFYNSSYYTSIFQQPLQNIFEIFNT